MEACFQELSITRAASVSYFHEVTQHYKVGWGLGGVGGFGLGFCGLVWGCWFWAGFCGLLVISLGFGRSTKSRCFV